MKRRYGVPGSHLAIEDGQGPKPKEPKLDLGAGPVIQVLESASAGALTRITRTCVIQTDTDRLID